MSDRRRLRNVPRLSDAEMAAPPMNQKCSDIYARKMLEEQWLMENVVVMIIGEVKFHSSCQLSTVFINFKMGECRTDISFLKFFAKGSYVYLKYTIHCKSSRTHLQYLHPFYQKLTFICDLFCSLIHLQVPFIPAQKIIKMLQHLPLKAQ